MNWEMIGAIGQLAGVLVGIPSIIYLAIQIRAQTEERRVSAVNTLTVQWGDMTNALHDSAELSEIYLRGAQSFADLDPVSKLRFSTYLNRFVNYFEAMHFAHRDGFLTESAWGKVERTMSDLVACPGVQQWGRCAGIGTHQKSVRSLMRSLAAVLIRKVFRFTGSGENSRSRELASPSARDPPSLGEMPCDPANV